MRLRLDLLDYEALLAIWYAVTTDVLERREEIAEWKAGVVNFTGQRTFLTVAGMVHMRQEYNERRKELQRLRRYLLKQIPDQFKAFAEAYFERRTQMAIKQVQKEATV